MARVQPEPNSGCWLWATGKSGEGYGITRDPVTRRVRKAHRTCYEMLVGPVPNGLMVLHHCDTQLCVNPDHLYTGTALDNSQDMIRRGRVHDQKRTHCFKNTHALTPENVYLYFDKKHNRMRRACRACQCATARRWYRITKDRKLAA